MESGIPNAEILEREMLCFDQVLKARVNQKEKNGSLAPLQLPAPEWKGETHPYATFVERHQLSKAERLVLMLAMIPEIDPCSLDLLLRHFLLLYLDLVQAL